MKVTFSFRGYVDVVGMMADAPTDEVPSVAALLMLPMLNGADPLFNPMQYTVSRVKSFAIVLGLTIWAVTMMVVLPTLDKERYETKGRVENTVGADVGVVVGEKAVATV